MPTKRRDESQGSTLTRDRVREPARYNVFLHNDDFTTMEFVVQVLVDIFLKSALDAEAIMLAVHRQGIGLCGTYTREIAEAKVEMVAARARAAGYPLRCTMERA